MQLLWIEYYIIEEWKNKSIISIWVEYLVEVAVRLLKKLHIDRFLMWESNYLQVQ